MARKVAETARAIALDALAKAEAELAQLRAAPPPAGAVDTGKLRDVYDAINDILSEMRNNVILAQGELPQLQGEPAIMAAISEAIDALVTHAEAAKVALRQLRELAG